MALIIGPVHITIFKSIKVNKLNGKYFQRYLYSLHSLSLSLSLFLSFILFLCVCRNCMLYGENDLVCACVCVCACICNKIPATTKQKTSKKRSFKECHRQNGS